MNRVANDSHSLYNPQPQASHLRHSGRHDATDFGASQPSPPVYPLLAAHRVAGLIEDSRRSPWLPTTTPNRSRPFAAALTPLTATTCRCFRSRH